MSNKKFSVVLILVMLLVAATLTAGPMGNRFTQAPVTATPAASAATTPIAPAGYGRGYGATLATDTNATARNFVPGTNLTEDCLVTGEAPVLGGRVMQSQMIGNLSARGNMVSQQPMGRGVVANQLPAGRGNMVSPQPMGRGVVANQLPAGRGNMVSQQPMGRGVVANQLPAGRGNMVNQMPASRGAGQGWSR
jgi:hypothetical protein